MNLKTFIVIVSFFFSTGLAYSQENKLDSVIDVPDFSGSKKDFLHQLELLTPLTFSYTNEINVEGHIIIHKQKNSIRELLKIVFPDNAVRFHLSGNKILLVPQASIIKPPLNFTVSGYISDSLTGEKLMGVFIYMNGKTKGTVTNNYGFYSFTLPRDSFKLMCFLPGYRLKSMEVMLNRNITLDLSLSHSLLTYGDSSPPGRSTDLLHPELENVLSVRLQALPFSCYSTDIIKEFRKFPGIKERTEGSSGMYVRGGGPDENLLLIDGTPVYNANHLFSFMPVFNPDAISNIKLIKGNFPSRYGGRLSSVLDIYTKEGDNKRYKVGAEAGVLYSKLSVEGPIIKDKSSFIISGRKTYVDTLAKLFMTDDHKIGYGFYDINARVNFKFSEKNYIFLSIYSGKDKYDYYDKFQDPVDSTSLIQTSDISWQNTVSTLRWNWKISNKLFSSTAVSASKYSQRNKLSDEHAYVDPVQTTTYHDKYSTGIDDITGRIDFDYIPSPNHYIKFGIQTLNHAFSPIFYSYQFKTDDPSESMDTTIENKKKYFNEHIVYLEDELKISEKIKANIGIHYNGYDVRDKFYNSVEPRVSFNYFLSKKVSVIAAFDQMNQNILLLSTSVNVFPSGLKTINYPNDFWVPATDKIKPIRSRQYSLGADMSLCEHVNLSIEGFYKELKNVIEYKNNTDYTDIYWVTQGWKWEDNIVQGKGWSYGAEAFIEKTNGKTTGWIGYTLSWSQRKFDSINYGNKFPYRYDRRHDIAFVLRHKINSNIDLGFTWSYGSGTRTTFSPYQYLSAMDNSGSDYLNASKGINEYRLPAYHSLDISCSFRKQKKWGERTWSICVYNAYNRMNPFYMFYKYEYKNGSVSSVLKKICIFPVMPNISYIININ
jgi:hypothetical protein